MSKARNHSGIRIGLGRASAFNRKTTKKLKASTRPRKVLRKKPPPVGASDKETKQWMAKYREGYTGRSGSK